MVQQDIVLVLNLWIGMMHGGVGGWGWHVVGCCVVVAWLAGCLFLLWYYQSSFCMDPYACSLFDGLMLATSKFGVTSDRLNK